MAIHLDLKQGLKRKKINKGISMQANKQGKKIYLHDACTGSIKQLCTLGKEENYFLSTYER